jgi:DNA-binding CsgD family transcriptional regulator
MTITKQRKPLRWTDPAWLELLGETARAIGSDAFPARLLRLFGGLIRHDMAMVVRYARFSAPDFLVSDGASAQMIESYRAGWYRFDPFYAYCRRRERGGVVSLRDVAPPTLVRSRYRAFQRQANICDELGMFLPGVGRVSIALFLERSQGWFTAAEKERARRVYPAVAGLYRAHLGRVFAALGDHKTAAGQGDRALLLVDRDGTRIHAAKAWRVAERESEVKRAMAELTGRSAGHVALSDNRVLHVEPLEADFPLAPGGRIYVIERLGLAPAPLSPRAVIARFGQALTPREKEIVELILEGHPSITIAKRLGIGRGTVKNHRRRLYDKLDITSERELFLLYLDWLSRFDPTSAMAPQKEPIR